MAPTAAAADELVKIYGTGDAVVKALDGVSVTVEAGALTAVMGPSGSGKSTLMHCMAGLDRPTSGRAFIGQTDVATLTDRKLTLLRRERVGFIFQQFNLVPTLTARENILLPLAIAGRKPDPQWWDTVIDVVGLADRLDHKPTGNLDSMSATEVLGFLRRSVDEFGQTIVMVTHDPVSASYADRALFLADGRIVDDICHPTHDAVLTTMSRLDPRRHPSIDSGPDDDPAPHRAKTTGGEHVPAARRVERP